MTRTTLRAAGHSKCKFVPLSGEGSSAVVRVGWRVESDVRAVGAC